MLINAIILSNTKTVKYHDMVNRCIDTMISSTPNHTFKVFLFESNHEAKANGWTFNQPEVETIVPDEAFNFNRFYNLGLEKCTAEYVLLLNNDLIFEEGSVDKMVEAFAIDPELWSVSPWEPKTHKTHKASANLIYGYTIIRYICGWALMVKKDLFNIIGPYDERFVFWYQDNDYSENLKKHGIKHALVRDAVVHHLGSVSHKTIPKGQAWDFKQGLRQLFIDKWKTKKDESKSLF